MNIEEARDNLETIVNAQDGSAKYRQAYDNLNRFINDVEYLLQHNSIKQTPALLKAKK